MVASEPSPFDFDAVEFVTADSHFGHARIVELAQRPFASLAEMDAEMVRRWNAVVGPEDVVLHLGDLALGELEVSLGMTSALNGRRLLVPGNHDRVSPARQSMRAVERFRPLYEEAGWDVLPETIQGVRRGRELLASHYPYRFGEPPAGRRKPHAPRWSGLPLIHGHTHVRDRGAEGYQFHVGVDAFEFAPVHFEVIDAWLAGLSEEAIGQ